jgi:predicted component of type VI protein secretion system
VLFLRQRLTHADAQGDRAVVSKVEMVEHLRVFERDKNVDHARFERQMENAVEKAKKLSLLHKLRGGDERFEISPTLKLLFPAEEIQALAQSYSAIAQAAAQGAAAGELAADSALLTRPSSGEDELDEEVDQ